jgi:hypothetical protein
VQLKQQLFEADISCFIKNELLAGGTGDLPFTETWPELWLHKKSDYPEAIKIVNEFKKTLEDGRDLPDWTCPNCGEDNDGNFGICWSCGQQATPEPG